METQPFVGRAIKVNDDAGLDEPGKEAEHKVVLDLHADAEDLKRPDERNNVILMYAGVDEQESQDRDLSGDQVLGNHHAISRKDDHAGGLEVGEGGSSPKRLRDQRLKLVNSGAGEVDIAGDRRPGQPAHLVMNDFDAIGLI